MQPSANCTKIKFFEYELAFHGTATAFAGGLFDLTQTRLSDVLFILRPLRGRRARRLDHLRDIWRSCVSAAVAGSNTVEG